MRNYFLLHSLVFKMTEFDIGILGALLEPILHARRVSRLTSEQAIDARPRFAVLYSFG